MVERLNFSNRFKKWAVTLILLPVIVFYRFFEGIPRFSNFQMEGKIANLVVGGVIFGIWLFYKYRWGGFTENASFDQLFLLFVIFIVIKQIFSDYPGLSFEYSLMVVGYVLVFYMFLDLHRNYLVKSGLVNGILLVTCIVFIYVGLNISRWFDIYEIRGSDLLNFGYLVDLIPRQRLTLSSNVLAVNMILVLPLAGTRLLQAQNKIEKGVYAGLSAGCLLVLLLTKSRGGLLGLMTMMGAFLLVYWSSSWKKEDKGVRKYLPLGLLSAGVLGAAGYILVSRGLPSTVVDAGRINIWKATLKMIRDYPLTGIDLGSFGINFIQYREKFTSPFLAVHPHNELLTLLVQFGLIGGVILLLYLSLIIRDLITNLEQIIRVNSFEFACLLSVLGYLAHGLVESFSNIPQIMVLFIFMLTGLISKTGVNLGADRGQKDKHRYRLWGLTAGVMFLGLGSMANIYQNQPYEEAVQAASRGNFQEAISAVDTAVERSPDQAYYQHVRAVLLGSLAWQGEIKPETAIRAYYKSVEDYSRWAPEQGNLASLLWLNGEPEEAIKHLDLAVTENDKHYKYHCLKGEILFDQEKNDQAIGTFGQCLARKTDSVNSPYWQSDRFRRVRLEEIIRVAEEELVQSENEDDIWKLLSLYHHAGEEEKFNKLYEYLISEGSYPERIRFWEALKVYKDGNLGQACQLFEKIVRDQPRSKGGWDMLAECFLAGENWSQANKALRISLAIRETAKTYSLYGQYFESIGERERAIHYYQAALLILEQSSDQTFATWVARKPPLPVMSGKGFPEIYSWDEYYHPAIRLAELLTAQDCEASRDLYQQMISISPGLEDVKQDYHELNCELDQ